MKSDDLLRRLTRMYEAGDPSLVADVARHFLLDSPDDGRLLELFGVASFDLKDFDAAREALERATALVPLHPMAQFALASCYAAGGDRDLAAEMFEFLTGVATDTVMLSAVARRLGGLGRDESALQACRRIQSLAPEHHQASFGEVYYLQRLGRPHAELVRPLARAVELAPAVMSYRVNLAFALEKTGRVEEACDHLREVPLESLDCPCLLRRMRGLFERAGDAGRALACGVRLACVLQ